MQYALVELVVDKDIGVSALAVEAFLRCQL
jgi:hypothetical protein